MVSVFFVLTKGRISFSVALTALITGIIALGSAPTRELLLVCGGIYLFASASSALNQLQERDRDALMERTKNRPLVTGNITPIRAGILILALLLFGSFLFWYSGTGWMPFLFSVVSLILYNFIYTPLKPVTSTALFFGSLVGSFPLVSAWLAAGGGLYDPGILVIATFMFVAQIPHSWIIELIYYKQYQDGGFKNLTSEIGYPKVKRLTSIWLIFMLFMPYLFFYTGLISNLYIMVYIGSFWLFFAVYFANHFIIKTHVKKLKRTFVLINVFFLFTLLFVMVSKLEG